MNEKKTPISNQAYRTESLQGKAMSECVWRRINAYIYIYMVAGLMSMTVWQY